MKFTISIKTNDPEIPTLLANVASMVSGEKVDLKYALDAFCLVADAFFDVYGAEDKDRLEVLGLIKNKAELLDGRPTTKKP